MAAEKNRDIGSMTMAREVEEKAAELHIQRIQGGWGGSLRGQPAVYMCMIMCVHLFVWVFLFY